MTTNYPCLEDLPEGERALFSKWLEGQTCPMVPNALDGSRRTGYYPWDYRRWVRQRDGGVESAHTWD